MRIGSLKIRLLTGKVLVGAADRSDTWRAVLGEPGPFPAPPHKNCS